MFLLQRIVGTKRVRARLEKLGIMNRVRNRCLFVAMSVAVWWLFFVYRFVSDGRGSAAVPRDELQQVDGAFVTREQADSMKSNFHLIPEKFTSRDALSKADEDGSGGDICAGRYVYMHELPREFNEGLLDDCRNLSLWSDVCQDIMNIGFGLPMVDPEGVFSGSGWYVTSQFSLEIIFHNKMKHYKCRTMDSSKANAVFVPFYTGMEVMPHLWDGANITHRDQVPLDFANWVTSKPEWSRLDGHDHFMIGGRVTWDFRRVTDRESDWGNNLLLLDSVKNMTTLTIEASPWHSNDIGIPYPTYFHPSTDSEVLDWQDRVARLDRKSLFCFAGAPRPSQDASIRGQIMTHCKESDHCSLMECGKLAGRCHSPANVMKLFKESHFCLQPPGDSYTRRSIFDAILSGCIPVVFHPYSAYTQYGWFFPAENSSYSVFIDEELVRDNNVSIEQVLRSYSPQEIDAMRKVVISLIPRILYSEPVNNMTVKDAFDLSMDGVTERIRDYQRSLEMSKVSSDARPKDLAQKMILDAKARLDSLLKSRVRPG